MYALKHCTSRHIYRLNHVAWLKCINAFQGDCQWAKWLLLSRIKGREYEASLSNARSNLSRQMVLNNNLSVLEIDEIICTVDDMAEGGGEMAALATLMYASAPIQNCLCTGSVNRRCSFSFQCTLENLRPGLQRFPTLWKTLVNACFGQDENSCNLNSNAANGKFLCLDNVLLVANFCYF